MHAIIRVHRLQVLLKGLYSLAAQLQPEDYTYLAGLYSFDYSECVDIV